MIDCIYIPSKKRSSVLSSNLRKCTNTGDKLYIVIEPDDYDDYSVDISTVLDLGDRASILVLPECNRGIAYARNYCCTHAESMGYDVICMSDDEVVLHSTGSLFTYARSTPLGGVGAYQSYYGFSLGLSPNTGLHRHRKSMGMICMTLRVDVCRELGGFDESLIRYSDYDFRAKAFLKGYDWYIDTESSFTLAGSSHSKGGLESIGANSSEVQLTCYDILHRRYGNDLVRLSPNREKNKVIFSWSKFTKKFSRG